MDYNILGLKEQGQILLDKSGVAHIVANNSHDLFFLQGFNAARDRLWQIDLWRKRGLGLLAKDFGPGYLMQDHAARLFLYRGDMEKEWAAYGEGAQDICTAFANGINAYIDAIEVAEFPLPPEFKVFDTVPSRWQAEDIVRIRTHSLSTNASSEFVRAKIFAQTEDKELAAYLDFLRHNIEPDVKTMPFGDFDTAKNVPEQLLKTYYLAYAPVTFEQKRLNATLEDANRWSCATWTGQVLDLGAVEGSNNWAISLQKTTTGRPILALDPHRGHTLPSIRYVVHLTMPDLDVIGAGEPAVPGISMGHNGHAAFALTIFWADQEDIYHYAMIDEKVDGYHYQGLYEETTKIIEKIEVKGYESQDFILKFTQHGPIIFEDKENKRFFALRSALLDAGCSPYMASLNVMRSKSPSAYLKALETWGAPSVNHIYADREDNILWKPAGAFPKRENFLGLLPVCGEGGYEWQGYLDPQTTPSIYNPSCGFVATANAMNIPQDWLKDNTIAMGYEWSDCSRVKIIEDFLKKNDKISMEDCAKLQNSTTSYSVNSIKKHLDKVDKDSLKNQKALKALWMLQDWDGDMAANSPAAALFEIWFNEYLGQKLASCKGATDKQINAIRPFDTASLRIEIKRIATKDYIHFIEILDETLALAFETCCQKLGEEPKSWQWGKLHQLKLRHPLQNFVKDDWSIPALEMGGAASTPNMAIYNYFNYDVVVGPSVRMLIDVGEWDNSVFINTPGQSGDPKSHHYKDLQKEWQNGQYRPLLYSKEAIMQAVEKTYNFTPKVL